MATSPEPEAEYDAGVLTTYLKVTDWGSLSGKRQATVEPNNKLKNMYLNLTTKITHHPSSLPV